MSSTNPSFFPTPSHDRLSRSLLHRALNNLDPYTISNHHLFDFFQGYASPDTLQTYLFTHMHMPSSTGNYFNMAPPQPAYFYMPSLENSYNYIHQLLPHDLNGYNTPFPMYYPMQQYDGPVGYVDEVAIISFEEYDINSRPSSTPLGYDGPVGYVDEVAIISFEDDESFDDYEHLLELQEQIGQVHVGLSNEIILKNLKTSTFPGCISKEEGEEEGELCAVCQDEYKVRETIGTLQCGHRYHANCIKEWLLHKNVCPICKATAFPI